MFDTWSLLGPVEASWAAAAMLAEAATVEADGDVAPPAEAWRPSTEGWEPSTAGIGWATLAPSAWAAAA